MGVSGAGGTALPRTPEPRRCGVAAEAEAMEMWGDIVGRTGLAKELARSYVDSAKIKARAIVGEAPNIAGRDVGQRWLGFP